MRARSMRACILIAAVTGLTGLLGGCTSADVASSVPVRLHVTNRTDGDIVVRWKDNKISGESDPIAPGSIGDVDARFTTRGAGDMRLTVVDRDGQTIRAKRIDPDVLRAGGFTRRLTVVDAAIAESAQ